jgi:hypothetical protein
MKGIITEPLMVTHDPPKTGSGLALLDTVALGATSTLINRRRSKAGCYQYSLRWWCGAPAVAAESKFIDSAVGRTASLDHRYHSTAALQSE